MTKPDHRSTLQMWDFFFCARASASSSRNFDQGKLKQHEICKANGTASILETLANIMVKTKNQELEKVSENGNKRLQYLKQGKIK